MLSLRGLWTRHRRKALIALGVLGSGFVVYKLYDAHRKRITDFERQLEEEREVDELIKAQVQTHFENIQRISDTTTLPYAMHYLRSRISEDLDLSHLTEKLMQGKGQASTISAKEKLELWERLKVLSFTRTASSLWSMALLCLYVRVQVNILGRHLYLEIAHGLERPQLLDESDSLPRHFQQDFLATADYLSTCGISSLIVNMESVVTEVLKGKQLKETFSMDQLHETIIQILDNFMSSGEPNYWINYLVPEIATEYRQLMAISADGFDDSSILLDVSRLEQLMLETRAVLSSPDFKNVINISLRKVVDLLIEDMGTHFGDFGETGLCHGIPLAKLLPRVVQLGPSLLEEPSSNRFAQTIRSLPEVELFYRLLYTNMPPASS